jgi:hypothetical protein
MERRFCVPWQNPINFAAEGLRLALSVERNCGIRVQSCSSGEVKLDSAFSSKYLPRK